MTCDERQAARDRCERAEPGPWACGNGSDNPADDDYVWAGPPDWGGEDLIQFHRCDVGSDSDWHGIKADCEFIAHARTDLPAALDALDAKDAEIYRLQVLCSTMLAALTQIRNYARDSRTGRMLSGEGYAAAEAAIAAAGGPP